MNRTAACKTTVSHHSCDVSAQDERYMHGSYLHMKLLLATLSAFHSRLRRLNLSVRIDLKERNSLSIYGVSLSWLQNGS